MKSPNFLAAAVLLLATTSLEARTAPSFLAHHHASPADRQAIEQVLAAYTSSLSSGDEKRFAALLLNEQIPFMASYAPGSSAAGEQPLDTRRYADFRLAVFASGKHFEQRFYNVRIEQDGELAQASLDFVTKEANSQKGSYGWKTLQLLKVNGAWKIASELYTAYALPMQ
ncbi:nuclear transport factor 2 family protein [Collimonas pratensis]|uniref:Lumazine-binding family protein n=1 Tax=Collimonas pratensis TaxID=279113 RepID=A0ABM5ZBW6_9BURK|nr:nuclear transport factor 2 family protein [Collimonas pratensis]AMP16672.1 lumazine-binding family protein [Collimonas pratensis]